jgi:hypothetical protein
MKAVRTVAYIRRIFGYHRLDLLKDYPSSHVAVITTTYAILSAKKHLIIR